MIECIFTMDYEIYGNGTGSLLQDVYEPAEKLAALFKRYNARFVVFAEVAELEVLEAAGTDPGIGPVKEQLRRLHRDGFEIGMHLHPQWYNARHENGMWVLDYGEYNLCTLPEQRIEAIVDRAIIYLRTLLGQPDFTPVSFRAGNWLFQPTKVAAGVLAQHGLKVDSSVFKGGLQRTHNLDYRGALRNGDYWFFSDRVEVSDSAGALLELPIHTDMVPAWKMSTARRMRIQHKGSSGGLTQGKRVSRLRNFLRLRYPRKLDFCRMEAREFVAALGHVIKQDRKTSMAYRPIVAIGHTKDLTDSATVDAVLDYLKENGISFASLSDAYRRCSDDSTPRSVGQCGISR